MVGTGELLDVLLAAGPTSRPDDPRPAPARPGPARRRTGPRGPTPTWCRGYRALGVERPWMHQVEAADAAWSGRHTVLATSTGSGKSLAFWLPALSTRPRRARPGRLLDPGRIESRRPAAPRTLYLCPTKALAADQLAALDRLLVAGRTRDVRVATCDGDTSLDERRWVQEYARRRAHQPRLPALRAPAAAPALGAAARLAAVRRARRVPRVPRGLRRARRPGPAAAAPARRVVRRVADVPAGVRDDLRPGRERRPADRRRPVRGHGRHRRRLARRPQDVRAVAAARAARLRRALVALLPDDDPWATAARRCRRT